MSIQLFRYIMEQKSQDTSLGHWLGGLTRSAPRRLDYRISVVLEILSSQIVIFALRRYVFCGMASAVLLACQLLQRLH